MQGFSAKQKLVLIVVSALVAFGVVLFVVLKPLSSDLDTLHQEVQAQKDHLNLLILEEASYKTVSADLERIKERVEEIKSLFPDKEQLVRFVERLEAIAQNLESDFAITITDTAEGAQTSGTPATEQQVYTIVPNLQNVEVIPFDFRLSGSFIGVVQFLQTLENQPFFSEVESFALRSEISNTGGIGDSTLQSRSGKVNATIRSAFYSLQK